MSANQSRRRADIANEGKEPTQDEEGFEYLPLNPNVHCTRLVRIHPADRVGDTIACTLFHVTFAERPGYEALSYMWGDCENDQKTIFVNGKKFSVGRNLWDALDYLRSEREKGVPIWIDALCINQNDTPERSRQLRIMRHIYSRACTVVVWLGKKYIKYQGGVQLAKSEEYFLPQKKDLDLIQSSSFTETADFGNERAMARELCVDGYWDRLWIVQEITQAQRSRVCKIDVCFGSLVMGWDMFIHFVAMHGCAEGGPLRFDRQLSERYTGSHTLKKLLKDHQAAKCKEPKDKIYGLVGLAADARGFPIDYAKSTFEVWVDTMEFMNRRKLLQPEEIVDIGSLVKSLLMDSDCTPLRQSLGTFQPDTSSTLLIEDMNSAKVFDLRGYILGYVCYVGPPTSYLVGDLDSVDEWETFIQYNFRHELGEAHRDNNYLLEALLGATESKLDDICSNHISTVRWKSQLDKDWPEQHTYRQVISEIKNSDSNETASNMIPFQISESPKSFQIHTRRSGYTPWKMGIASRLVQKGDLICCVPGIESIMVVKVHEMDFFGANLQIFGTGKVVDNLVGYKWDKSRQDRQIPRDGLSIKMDARTLFVLLA
ncbi:hypothetical protein RRF57_004271 [Xylaria bambusicola]|uniref:Heterokaryon incompatibility domain-containing protein n=1 Tax=Xylaria bambusicola TaxID=326684 RepID=A0AAN7UNI5_9PEZI